MTLQLLQLLGFGVLLVALVLYARLYARFSSSLHHLSPLEAHIFVNLKLDNTKHLAQSNSSTIMACKFPSSLDPWSPEIKEVLTAVPLKANCAKEDFVYSLDPETSILLRTSTSSKWTNCCYKAVFRVTDNEERFSDCRPIFNGTTVPPDHEFLAVFCDSVSIKSQMVQVLAHVSLKPEVESRLSPKDADNGGRLNILIHVWDSMAEMELRRAAPKLREFLVHNLSAFWFEGYTKVGDNTGPNLRSLLTWDPDCGKDGDAEGCSLIYHDAAKRGYRISEAYDYPSHWIYSYKNPPLDYNFRPLSKVAAEAIGRDRRDGEGLSPLCWGPQLALQSLLDYSKALAITMGRNRRWLQMVLSTALTHDFPLYGGLGEDVMLTFLTWMQKEGVLNHTAFVFLGDHGQRTSAIRATPQGSIESRLPMLYIVLPEWFRKQYPQAMKNLRVNRERLTTHFDTHATLLDLLDPSQLTDDAIAKRTQALHKAQALSRALSLFLPIPQRRTCGMAGIDAAWCVCGSRTQLSPNSSEAWEGAKAAVVVVNDYVSTNGGKNSCALLSLSSVRHVTLLQDDTRNSVGDLVEVGFSTSPSNASFEAVVAKEKGKETWSVSGAISRTNLYGNQSWCLGKDRVDLKKYCFCL